MGGFNRNDEEKMLFRHMNIIKDLFLINGVSTFIINELIINSTIQPDGTEITRRLFDLDPRCNDQPTLLLCWLMRFVHTEHNSVKRKNVFNKIVMWALKFTPYYSGQWQNVW